MSTDKVEPVKEFSLAEIKALYDSHDNPEKGVMAVMRELFKETYRAAAAPPGSTREARMKVQMQKVQDRWKKFAKSKGHPELDGGSFRRALKLEYPGAAACPIDWTYE